MQLKKSDFPEHCVVTFSPKGRSYEVPLPSVGARHVDAGRLLINLAWAGGEIHVDIEEQRIVRWTIVCESLSEGYITEAVLDMSFRIFRTLKQAGAKFGED